MKTIHCFLGAAIALVGAQVAADVKLPSIFSDNMVFQRDTEVRVWGWADNDEEVTVSLNGQTAKTTAAKGVWEVVLKPMPASSSGELTVAGKNTLKFTNVAVGEVWICSGQSNMEWRVQQSDGANEAIAAANIADIRLFQGNTYLTSTSPQSTIPGAKWVVSTGETARGFSAVGFFFAREINRELKVPVGMISTNWGGTRIEPWTPAYGFTTQKSLEGIANQLAALQPGKPKYDAYAKQAVAELETWIAFAKSEVANGRPLPDRPDLPGELRAQGSGNPSVLFNNMVAPVSKFALRGMLWYQGCANVSDGMLYADKMKALIAGWRKEFNNPKMPIYFVQLAPFNYNDPNRLPTFWEAQQAFADSDENAGMAVITDIGNFRDIHPKNKLDVAKRLALMALKRDYGMKDLVADSPFFQSMEKKGKQLVVTFRNAKTLSTTDGKEAKYFEISGADGKFYPATAVLEGNKAILSSDKVADPCLMRYAWNPDITTNLVNENKLPAGTCRAGELPALTDILKDIVPETTSMQLVYSFAPTKARNGQNANYIVDNSTKITGTITKVGYLMFLLEPGGKMNYSFVTMDPFTTDVKKIGLPVPSNGEQFQNIVKNLFVKSNVEGVKNGTFEDGNIEFYFSNYSPPNSAKIPGASDGQFDFGDTPSGNTLGYGSMQVHNYREKQTVFAFNNHGAGPQADIGIGPARPGDNPDFTFNKRAGQYDRAEILVFVETK